MTPDALRALAAAQDLPLQHPPAVLAEAGQWVTDPGIDDPSLEDLTHLPFVTIDEEHSKDLDQALFVEQTDDGYTVWYAIADAAWYVRPGTAVFAEALRRGSSFYLPGLVLPMLPKLLSEGIVSLNEGVDRRAMVFRVDLAEDGTVRETRILRGRVRSRVKTWYDAVQAWFDGTAACPGDEAVATSLRALRAVGERRCALASARDVIQFRRAEVAIRVGEQAETFVALDDPRNDVELWNEQISLLCNTEGARMLRDHPSDRVQAIYRSHEPPRAEAIAKLRRQLHALVKARDLDPSWVWSRNEPLKDFLDRLPHGRVARAMHRQALLSWRGAVFSTSPDRHFGVGSDVYGRFTAPMREVVGVWVHKETWELLGADTHTDEDEALREQVIAVSHAVRRTQRELDQQANRLVLDALFAADQNAGTTRTGTLMGLSRGRLHVQLDSPAVDVKLYTRHLERRTGPLKITNDDTVLRKADGSIVSRVGDAVEVEVLGRDTERDRWELALA